MGTVASETASVQPLTSTNKNTKSKVRSYTKKIDANKVKATSSGGKMEVLNLRASMASGSKHKYLSQRSSTAASSSASAAAVSKQPPQPHDNQSQISSSREGSFRFLEHEEIEHTPTPKRPHKEDDDANSIQWSTNSDRLI